MHDYFSLDAQVIISDVSDGPESSGRMKRQDSPSDGRNSIIIIELRFLLQSDFQKLSKLSFIYVRIFS